MKNKENYRNSKIRQAINWNKINDGYSKTFWDQNIRQFWVDEEISLAEDKKVWPTLTNDERDTYEKILAGLTLLDTEQGGLGMPQVLQYVDNLHAKAVLTFMAAMEQMHAKSYSTIFSTLSSSERIEELFEWVKENKHLQAKANIVIEYYKALNDKANDEALFKAMTASVMLETYLFYSGFFYPLWFSGQSKLIGSGEIINLIIRDESVHGVFVGLLAQDVKSMFSKEKQEELNKWTYDLMLELFKYEKLYTKDLYKKVGLVDEVITFVKYNADKALMNLGLEPHWNIKETDVNPIIINGLDTETKTHDFFSTKGNGYIKTTKYDDLSDDDFDW